MAMRILFFSPFSGVAPFIRAQTQVAKSLRERGHTVMGIHCNGLYKDFCITMSALGLKEASTPSQKQAACRTCKRMREASKDLYLGTSENIDDAVLPGDSRIADSFLETVSPENWLNSNYDGLPVGRIASYEFLINHKKTNFTLTSAELDSYRIALRNTLMTQLAMARTLSRLRPECVVIWDTGYSVNGMVKALANRMGISVYNLSFGFNLSRQLSTLVMGSETSISHLSHVKTVSWEKVKSQPLNSTQVRLVGEHFQALFKATNVFVYSAPRSDERIDIRGRFGVAKTQKLLVASLSSYDERMASGAIGRASDGSSALFASQAAWCKALIQWVASRPKYFLVIRVHPREFPNKRESVKSAHAEELASTFEDLPANVTINWPTDKLSIYDLAEEADAFLSAWSSVGVEMSALGLPVVIYADDWRHYPTELNFVGNTEAEYFARVEEAAATGWDFEKMRLTFRWLSLLFTQTAINLPQNEDIYKSWVQRGLRLLSRKTGWKAPEKLAERLYLNQSKLSSNAILQVEDVLQNRKVSLADAAHKPVIRPASREEEEEAIRNEMERLFRGSSSRIITYLRKHFATN